MNQKKLKAFTDIRDYVHEKYNYFGWDDSYTVEYNGLSYKASGLSELTELIIRSQGIAVDFYEHMVKIKKETLKP